MIHSGELFSPKWETEWAEAASTTGIGVVYTKPEITAWMLDLAGYTEAGNPETRPLLDPGCGTGAFTLEAIRRLAASIRRRNRPWTDPTLVRAITAIEIDGDVLATTRAAAREILLDAGCSAYRAEELTGVWFIHSDFLLHDWAGRTFDFVVGNPPYVRLENLPKRLLATYRHRFATATERADLYVPFFELGLSLLSPTGTLAFICANRFAKNRYGADLRRLIASRHHVRAYVNLEHTQPFLGNVAAYPAIVLLDNRSGEPTAVAALDELTAETRAAVTEAILHGGRHEAVHHFERWHADGGPWIHSHHEGADFLATLDHHPLLEDSAPGTRVGIGVATGADKVFIRTGKPADIEAAALLPLIEASDIRAGGRTMSDRWLINPFRADGSLMDVADAPGLMRYMHAHEPRLRERHCAKKTPSRWYRTIDRIWPQWVRMPKLLLPDIQPGGIVAYDEGRFYPHHNVYWISSDGWNLRALQTLLRSEAVTRQVRAHSVQMRGGAIRYQSQSLRRVRIPAATKLSATQISRLAALAESPDMAAVNAAANEAFGLRP